MFRTLVTANPRIIVEDLVTAMTTNNLTWGWQRFDMLKSAEKEMRLFEFFEIQMAMLGSDSMYFSVIDKMLKEKKRDPRFFYLHQFSKYNKLHDYVKVVEQLKKLNEYTGTSVVQTFQLATYTALAGQFKESLEIAEELQKSYPELPLGLMHKLVSYYLMEDKVKFEATARQLQKKHDLAGDKLLNEIAANYPAVPAPRFVNLNAWVLKTEK